MTLSDADQSAAYYNRLAPRYDEDVTTTPGDRLARRAFVELVTSVVPTGATLLDFGSGTGLDVTSYVGRGYRVLAYDNSAGMMEQLQRRCAQEIASGRVHIAHAPTTLAGALTAWPRPDAVVSNFAVLNMIGDIAPLFHLLASRLSPRGYVIVSLVNASYWKHAITARWWRGWRRRLQGQPAHYLTHSFTSYLHSVPAVLRAAPDFELAGVASAGRLVRYTDSKTKTVRYWADSSAPGDSAGLKSALWHSPAARWLGTFTFLVLRARS